MNHQFEFYIGGAWRQPHGRDRLDVVDPSTEKPFASIATGSARDVDDAVAAARHAFDSYSVATREQRIALLESVISVYERRQNELADAVSREMGAPMVLARQAHAPSGLGHLRAALTVLREHTFEEVINKTRITREPVGVCALITPWNWPLNQIGCKVAAALAAGCTMVLKPSEMSPISALIFAEILHEAGVPPGVFNLVNGDGTVVGSRLSSHPDVDMVSFTGSTRAGILVAKAAADSVKRVHQELGGKSPNIVLDDADFVSAVNHGVRTCFNNSGQSCNAPTRLLVPVGRHEEVVKIALEAAQKVTVGDPRADATTMGPVSSAAQFNKIQALIQQGIDEGASLIVGGTGRPAGLATGYYVKPTIFAAVRNDMTIARQEIFGPVLAILPYESEDEAIAIANDSPYGLSSYVTSGNIERARKVARQMRAGMVHINGAASERAAAFGGYKQSGNGREWGRFGIEDFLEIKSMFGYEA